MHDFLKSAIRADVLWLQGTCARLEMELGNRRKANHSQQQQNRTRKNQHGRRFAYGPAHILPYDVEEPVITNCRLSVANKQEQNRAHEQTGDEMPIAMSTPSCEKLMAPLSNSARNPTAVVSAPKNTARPSLATEVAMAF